MFQQSINNRSKTIYESLNNPVTNVQPSFKNFQETFNNRFRIVQRLYNNSSTMV